MINDNLAREKPGQIFMSFDNDARGYFLFTFLTCSQAQSFKGQMPLKESVAKDFYKLAYMAAGKRIAKRTAKHRRVRFI